MSFPCEQTETRPRGYKSAWPISNTANSFKQVTEYNQITHVRLRMQNKAKKHILDFYLDPSAATEVFKHL